MTESYSTYDILQWMDADTRRAYGAAVRVRKYKPGQVIYLQGDSGTEMFRLVSGSVRMVVNRADGREIVYILFQPGDCFGDSSLVDGDTRPQTAEALTEVSLEVLDQSSFRRLRELSRSFDDALLRLLSRQMRYISMHFADANLSPLPVRIAGRVLSAAQSFGSQQADGLRLTVPLSQSELAAMVGASRQSVNKVLQAFQTEGLLRVEYGNLLILDLEGLQTHARRMD